MLFTSITNSISRISYGSIPSTHHPLQLSDLHRSWMMMNPLMNNNFSRLSCDTSFNMMQSSHLYFAHQVKRAPNTNNACTNGLISLLCALINFSSNVIGLSTAAVTLQLPFNQSAANDAPKPLKALADGQFFDFKSENSSATYRSAYSIILLWWKS